MTDAANGGERWWRDAAIYEIYVRSFADSDGDGVGDLRGITDRLPQLAELGVDAIWLTPFYPSPMVDGGYDVADYREVEPIFGDLHDFDSLLARAHAFGIRVIVDIVPNHTSDQHAWFQAALKAPAGSAERARYIFRDGTGPAGDQPPADWLAIFGGAAWTRVDDGQWYLHMFTPEQPDLNWANPEVASEFESILRFWLDRGVDGFRIDVAHGMAKDLTEPLPSLGAASVDKHIRYEFADHPLWDRDDVHEIFRSWRRILDEYTPPRIAVAEAWVAPSRRAHYVRPDELHQAFNFDYLETPWECSAFVDVIDNSLREAGAVGASATWVLSNHDVVRHPSRYALPTGADLVAWLLTNGIDPKPDVEQGLRRARAATLLMLALPGSAYLYQGEELGLPEVADLPVDALRDPTWQRSGHQDKGRDGCRVPIPWEPTGPSLGFGPAAPWLPQPPEWDAVARASQEGRPASTLELYRAALRLRRELPPDTELDWIERGPDLLAFRRSNGFVCVVNFGAAPAALPPGDVLLTSNDLDSNGQLPTDTAAWVLTK
ncbi:MAG: alpha-glucosidase [Actinomycetota bacterium]|nr:alpha-glucosidase [Actinomycetota bacterium]